MSKLLADIHTLIINLVEDQRTVLEAVKDAEKYLSDSITEEKIVDKILAESPNSFAIKLNPISTEETKQLFLEKHRQLLDGVRNKKTNDKEEVVETIVTEIEQSFKAELESRGCDPEDFVQLDLEITRVLLSPKSLNAIYQSLYILTFANFEAFLHQITKHCISMNDLILISSTKRTFSWSDIREEGAVSNIRESLIDETADNLMHQSMDKWLDWYEQKIKLRLDQDFRLKCETSYKLRNIFAHEKSSRSMYLNVASKEFVQNAADLLLALAFKITISLVQKHMEQDQIDEYLSRLSDTTVKLLQRGRNQTVLDICGYIFGLKLDGELLDLFKVNNWIASIALGDREKSRLEILDWDVTGKEPVFQLAKYSLLGQREQATELFDQLEKNGKLSRLEWETWPLFNSVK